LSKPYIHNFDNNTQYWELLTQCFEFSRCTTVLIVVWGLG